MPRLGRLAILSLLVACPSAPSGEPDESRLDASGVLPDSPPDDPCAGVDCGPGRCLSPDGVPECACDAGFRAEGLACVSIGCTGSDCPRPVAEWQAMFDANWAQPGELGTGADCLLRSESGGTDQEYYFLAYCIDGLTEMWRASGDNRYLDTVLELIGNTLDDAVMAPDGYRRWPVEYALWESFYWRFVVTLVRVMHQHPDLLELADYRARYQELLEFSEVHIWDKWASAGLGNLYRSRTHMASHWARIAMELHLITGNDRYLPVFQNISNGEMPGWPSNMRAQLVPNPEHPQAYVWSDEWGVDPAVSVQDTSHAAAVVSFIANAYDNGMCWAPADIAALSSTLTDIIWPVELGGNYHRYVDGTDGDATEPYGPPWGRLHEWLVLGRYDVALQRRIEADYAEINYTYFGIQGLGIAALNAKILTDGAPAY